MLKEYAVRYPGGVILEHKSESSAVAAVGRAQRFPCTKGAVLLRRQVAGPTTWSTT